MNPLKEFLIKVAEFSQMVEVINLAPGLHTEDLLGLGVEKPIGRMKIELRLECPGAAAD
jgi:hypothetical protein